MATSVTYNGNSYSVPAYNDTGYAQGSGNLSSYLVALATGSLTLAGGAFTLTADANFGTNFGLIALYLKSTTANIATAGFIRLARTDLIEWRNVANGANLTLGVDGSNNLTWNTAILALMSGWVPGTFIVTTGGGALTTLAPPIGVVFGGTGLASAAQGDLLYGSAANTLSALTKDTNATRYLSNTGTTNNPAWAQVALTTGVSGILPVANGGTNASGALSNNRVMKSSGGTIIEAAAITASRAVISDANGIPSTGTNPTNTAGYIKGTIVQTVTGTQTANVTTSSSTYVTTNLAASITPLANTHTIRVTVSGQIGNPAGSSCLVTLKRGSTDLDATGNGFAAVGSGATALVSDIGFLVIDSPATTSSTTYTVFFRSNAAALCNWNSGTFTSIITLEEVAA